MTLLDWLVLAVVLVMLVGVLTVLYALVSLAAECLRGR